MVLPSGATITTRLDDKAVERIVKRKRDALRKLSPGKAAPVVASKARTTRNKAS